MQTDTDENESALSPRVYPLQEVRAQFPVLARRVHDRPYIYLDSAATSQKPAAVIDRLHRFYSEEYATVRRGVYHLAAEATALFEGARRRAADFLNAGASDEIVFVRGTTEAINLVAHSWGSRLREGDEIVITAMEHHANIVPWQLLCRRTGARLRAAPITDDGVLLLDELGSLLGPRTKLVAIGHISNSLGTLNPVARVAAMAHAVGAVLLVDGAQSAGHMPIDVQDLGCDFFACSGHKMGGPTGIGLLWGRRALLADMPPWQGGGEMIDRVTLEESTFDDPPHRFEAGTPAIAEAIGLHAAMDWLDWLGLDRLHAWEQHILMYATERMRAFPGLRIVGNAPYKGGIVAFTMEGAHPFDIASILDRHGIAIRAGHHCAQPVMQRFGVPATARISFGPYTSTDDIDRFLAGLESVTSLIR